MHRRLYICTGCAYTSKAGLLEKPRCPNGHGELLLAKILPKNRKAMNFENLKRETYPSKRSQKLV